jgi:hypothetical protein
MAGIVAIALFGCGCRPHDSAVDQLIAHNTDATGGRAAIESIRSIQFQLHIVDPGFEVDGSYRAIRPGRMRIDITAAGKHVYTEAFNGTRGWQWKGADPIVDENPQAVAALRHGVELPGKLFGLHEMRSHGHTITLVGRAQITGTNYHVLQLKFSDGFTTSLYIDPATWLTTRRRDYRPLHVDIDPRPTNIETVFSDFRVSGGVRFPFTSVDTDLETGKVLETAHVTSIIINPAIEDRIFDAL